MILIADYMALLDKILCVQDPFYIVLGILLFYWSTVGASATLCSWVIIVLCLDLTVSKQIFYYYPQELNNIFHADTT